MVDAQPSHETEAAPAADEPKVPWYSLDPRTLKRSKLARAVLIGLLVAAFSVVPLWRMLWYYHVYTIGVFWPVTDVHGQRQQAWRWVEGKEIRVYALPNVGDDKAEEIAVGVRELLDDVGLDFTVKVLPMPAKVLTAYQQSLVTKKVQGTPTSCVDFGKLETRLIALRANDPHADMLVVDAPLAEAWWAHGMATFTTGTGVMERDQVSVHLGKHESGHLMGYLYHDSIPLFVIGYPWEGLPTSRDSLMMLYGESNEISPRARDALRYFWRGMERTNGGHYLRR